MELSLNPGNHSKRVRDGGYNKHTFLLPFRLHISHHYLDILPLSFDLQFSSMNSFPPPYGHGAVYGIHLSR
jgi:hypothetical protein